MKSIGIGACNENGCSDQWEVYIALCARWNAVMGKYLYWLWGRGLGWRGHAYTRVGGLLVAVDNGSLGFEVDAIGCHTR